MANQNHRRWYPRNQQNQNIPAFGQHATTSFPIYPNMQPPPLMYHSFGPQGLNWRQEHHIFEAEQPQHSPRRWDRRRPHPGGGFRSRGRNRQPRRGSRGFGDMSSESREEEEKVQEFEMKREADESEPFIDETLDVCKEVQDAPAESQRDELGRQLAAGSYECMICCNNVRRQVAIWSCDNCFHIFHLFCIKKWSQSMKVGVAPISPASAELARAGHKVWRCPACQKEHTAKLFRYSCFCGKAVEPETSPHVTPHTCGEMCGKSRGGGCPHLCGLLCHPGPCPPCDAFIPRSCLCGNISATSKCAIGEPLRCQKVCENARSCNVHACGVTCHAPPCPPCEEEIEIHCFCGATSRTVICGSPEAERGGFTCESTCGKQLNCANHNCSASCHPGECSPCPRQPDLVVTCPCGKQPIAALLGETDARTDCLQPIPTCADGVCSSMLPCGHACPAFCHDGPCPPCPNVRNVSCRCGKASKNVACADWDALDAGGFLCQRRCRKKKSCGRCRCGEQCCINVEHICMELCQGPLSCGLHTCEQLCHLGRCAPCQRVMYSELRCECGANALPPPIACGTPPPDCQRLCSRRHACTHPVRHNCHAEAECPPCTFLVSKPCLGGHTTRHNIPCSQRLVTCGQPCGRTIEPCGHLCDRPCHAGDCLAPEDGGACQQACTLVRSECGHPCGAPCHFGSPCPVQPCRQDLEVKCACGLRKKTASCHSLATLNKWELWGALQNSQNSGTSFEVELLSSRKTRQLECDDLCLQVERNRQLAEAFSIDADPMPSPGAPNYARFLKDFMRSNSEFGANVERALDELIRTAKESKHKSRSHAFAPGNRDKRRFVHELAEFYFCDTQSYDAEPNRSVVVTARKERCRVPTVRLSALIAEDLREEARLSGRIQPSLKPQGRPSVPAPSLSTPTGGGGGAGPGLKLLGRVPSFPSTKPEIDYFAD